MQCSGEKFTGDGVGVRIVVPRYVRIRDKFRADIRAGLDQANSGILQTPVQFGGQLEVWDDQTVAVEGFDFCG
jgi:hypothetical protein